MHTRRQEHQQAVHTQSAGLGVLADAEQREGFARHGVKGRRKSKPLPYIELVAKIRA